jgi:hypothetical protein
MMGCACCNWCLQRRLDCLTEHVLCAVACRCTAQAYLCGCAAAGAVGAGSCGSAALLASWLTAEPVCCKSGQSANP